MVKTVWVNDDHGRDLHPLADHGRDLHPLADHMTKLQNFTKEQNLDFSAFRFSFH